MARIVEYSAGSGVINPTTLGSSAIEGAARAVEGTSLAVARGGMHIRADLQEEGNAIKQGAQQASEMVQGWGQKIEQHQTFDEIAKQSADTATVNDNLSQTWDKVSSAPGAYADPDLASKFREQYVQPALDQLNAQPQTKGGKEYALQQQERLTAHWQDKLTADSATLGGIRVKENTQQFLNSSTNSVANDPSSLPAVRASVEPTIDALIANSPNIKGTAAASIKSEMMDKINHQLDHAAFLSMLSKNPGAAEAAVHAGAFPNVNGGEAEQMIKAAQVTARMEARAAHSLALQERAEAREKNTDTLLKSFANPADPNGPLQIPPGAINDMFKNSDKYGHENVGFLYHMADAIQKGEVVKTSDPNTFQDLGKRMTLDPDDANAVTPMQLVQAVNDKKLSGQDFNKFREEYNFIRSNPQVRSDLKDLSTWQDTMKGYITNSTIYGKNAYGDQRWGEFQSEMRDRFMRGEQSGLKPKDLLDQNSKDFIGKDVTRWFINGDQATRGFLDKAGSQGMTPLSPVRGVLPPMKTSSPSAQTDDEKNHTTPAKVPTPEEWLRRSMEVVRNSGLVGTP